MCNLLEVINLKTYFYTNEGTFKAVDGISYEIKKNECVGIVGESGCGKSVGAMSILKLIDSPPGRIVDGKVLFNGEDLLKTTKQRINQIRGNYISMVFQEPMTSLNPVLTIGTQLQEVLMYHKGVDKKEAVKESIKLLDSVGISDPKRRINDYPFQLSGGMQQRVMIAIALSCHPELLIADEPTTALDVTIQSQVLELLTNLKQKFGISILLITHNLGIVARYVNRLYVMYAGNFVETGTTKTIFKNPMHPYTIALLNAVPRLDTPKDNKWHAINGTPPNLAHLPNGCPFSPRCKYSKEICFTKKPSLEKIGENHYSACWRKSDLKINTE